MYFIYVHHAHAHVHVFPQPTIQPIAIFDESSKPGLNLGKDSGGLESTGYVYIGDDPESQESFNVDDEDGQRNFTTVKLFREYIEDLLIL